VKASKPVGVGWKRKESSACRPASPRSFDASSDGEASASAAARRFCVGLLGWRDGLPRDRVGLTDVMPSFSAALRISSSARAGFASAKPSECGEPLRPIVSRCGVLGLRASSGTPSLARHSGGTILASAAGESTGLAGCADPRGKERLGGHNGFCHGSMRSGRGFLISRGGAGQVGSVPYTTLNAAPDATSKRKHSFRNRKLKAMGLNSWECPTLTSSTWVQPMTVDDFAARQRSCSRRIGGP